MGCIDALEFDREVGDVACRQGQRDGRLCDINRRLTEIVGDDHVHLVGCRDHSRREIHLCRATFDDPLDMERGCCG